jgi:hypothetical protein
MSCPTLYHVSSSRKTTTRADSTRLVKSLVSAGETTVFSLATVGAETTNANHALATSVQKSKIRTEPMSFLLAHTSLNLRAMTSEWPVAHDLPDARAGPVTGANVNWRNWIRLESEHLQLPSRCAKF